MQPVTALVRLETVLAVSRATAAMLAILPLVVSGVTDTAGRPVPIANLLTLNAIYGLSGLLGIVAVRRCRTESAVRSFGMASVAYDVGFFTFYAVLTTNLRDVGSVSALIALVGGPARFGIAGGVATLIPVTATALLWPSPDAAGETLGPAAIVFLASLVSVTVTGVATMLRRASSAVRSATQQMHGAFENASIGMALLDPDGTVVRSNPALDAFFGARSACCTTPSRRRTAPSSARRSPTSPRGAGPASGSRRGSCEAAARSRGAWSPRRWRPARAGSCSRSRTSASARRTSTCSRSGRRWTR